MTAKNPNKPRPTSVRIPTELLARFDQAIAALPLPYGATRSRSSVITSLIEDFLGPAVDIPIVAEYPYLAEQEAQERHQQEWSRVAVEQQAQADKDMS